LKPTSESNAPRIHQLRIEVANLTDAIASGTLRGSKAIAERLSAAESELERLTAEPRKRKANVIDLPGQLVDRYRRLVAGLEDELSKDVHRARAPCSGSSWVMRS
jgi:hypothetical protein